MKKLLPLLFSVTILASCSSQTNQSALLPEVTDSQIQSASSKSFTFDHKNATKAKDHKTVNPSPQKLVITVKKLVKKNSSNPNQDNVYYQLSSAVENLANLDVSHDNTDGSQTYEGSKVFEFVKSANQNLLRITSIDPSLQFVHDAITSLNNANIAEGNVQYTDIKIFNALVYQALLDSYDGEKFYITAQKTIAVFSQMPQFAQQFDDSAKYMRQAIKYFATKYQSLSSFSNTNPINGESWENYTRRLRQMLQQIAKMG